MASRVRKFLRHTFFEGLFLLLPIILIGILCAKAIRILSGLMGYISADLDDRVFLGLSIATLLSVAALALLCLLTGLLMHIVMVSQFHSWLEKKVLHFVPGYEHFKVLFLEKFDEERKENDVSVLVNLNGNWQPGLLIEQSLDGLAVVFVPMAPNTTTGTIYVVSRKKIRRLNISLNKLQESINRFGKDLLAHTEALKD